MCVSLEAHKPLPQPIPIAMVLPVVMYGYESWTTKKAERQPPRGPGSRAEDQVREPGRRPVKQYQVLEGTVAVLGTGGSGLLEA